MLDGLQRKFHWHQLTVANSSKKHKYLFIFIFLHVVGLSISCNLTLLESEYTWALEPHKNKLKVLLTCCNTHACIYSFSTLVHILIQHTNSKTLRWLCSKSSSIISWPEWTRKMMCLKCKTTKKYTMFWWVYTQSKAVSTLYEVAFSHIKHKTGVYLWHVVATRDIPLDWVRVLLDLFSHQQKL